jgi:alkylation response protein AidB-like acyl-CoA dehydrogenase
MTETDLYTLPPDHLAVRDTVRRIARERIAPLAAGIDAAAEYPHQVRRLFAESDLLGLPFDEEHGGTGTGALMLNVAIEELARACASSALILMVQELGTLPIRLFGNDQMRERLLPRCASGEWSPALALSEREAATQATPDGDGWRISGRKSGVAGVGIATFYVVFAADSVFVVDAGSPGLIVDNVDDRLGVRGFPIGELVLEDVRVPAENLVGQQGRGSEIAAATLERARLGVAAQALGIGQAAADYAVAYARDRVQFGQPIGTFEANASKLADMEIKCAAGRQLLYQACAKADRGAPDAGRYSAMAKVFCSDAAMEIAGEALQILGGYGFVKDYPVERHLRDAKVTQVHAGTNEAHRIAISRARA